MMFVAHSAALLIDWLLLLFLVRVVNTRWQAVILAEVNDAARPLVDRTLAGVDRLWTQVRPLQRACHGRRILAAVLTLGLTKLLLAAVTGLAVTVG